MDINFVPNFNPGVITLSVLSIMLGLISLLGVLLLAGTDRYMGWKKLSVGLLALALVVGPFVRLPVVNAANAAAHHHNITALEKAVHGTYGISLTQRQAKKLVGNSDRVASYKPTIFMTVNGRKTLVTLRQETGKWYLMSDSQELLRTRS